MNSQNYHIQKLTDWPIALHNILIFAGDIFINSALYNISVEVSGYNFYGFNTQYDIDKINVLIDNLMSTILIERFSE